MVLQARLLVSVCVAIFGVVAYWHLASAYPNPVSISREHAKLLAKHAGSNSHEDKSGEEDRSGERPSSGDGSNEDDTDSAEVKVFSAKVVSRDKASSTVFVSNIQQWEKKKDTPPVDGTVMYFLDDKGEVPAMGNETISVITRNIACNNQKHQYYRESDRCNGIYECDDTGDDERNCPSKCTAFRYSYVADLVDCKAHIPRYFYDYELKNCVPFAYGGCAEVFNMFLSKTECERECAGIGSTTTTAAVNPIAGDKLNAESVTTTAAAVPVVTTEQAPIASGTVEDIISGGSTETPISALPVDA